MIPRTRLPVLVALAACTALVALSVGPSASARSTAPARSTAGTPVDGGNLVIARTSDSTSMNATNVFDNESIWVL